MNTIKLPFKLKEPVLACGADMKGAFAIAHKSAAYLADGFGDLSDPDNLARYGKAVESLRKKLAVTPKTVVCDMHPGYFSTRFARHYARRHPGAALYEVQHHEAHIASAMVDNGISGDVTGIAFDGTGFGTDGAVWGGEFFVGSPKGFRRAAHLEYVRMPGGDAAVKEPWRMAASFLYKAFGRSFRSKMKDADRARSVMAMIDKGINAPLTSSAGRLFDAVASLILDKDTARLEAELPFALEQLASKECGRSYRFAIGSDAGMLTVDPSPVIQALMKDIARRTDAGVMSAQFHNALSEAVVAVALKLKARTGIYRAVLSGGVFQNRYLSAKVSDLMESEGIEVFIHHTLSTNDSGIPAGQVAIARARGICA